MIKNKVMLIDRQGFTLFELLVSISIIGILMAVATMSYSNAQRKARDARRMEDLSSIQKAAESFYSNNSYSYPPNDQEFTSGPNPVLQSWPTDPKTGVRYNYQINIPATGRYCVCAGLDSATGNSNSSTCGAFVAGTGTSQCVTSQQ